MIGCDEIDRRNQINELPQPMLVEGRAGVVLGEDALEARVVALDGDHGVVHVLADLGELGLALEMTPAGLGRNPEDVLGAVFVRVLGVGPGVVPLTGREPELGLKAEMGGGVLGGLVGGARHVS